MKPIAKVEEDPCNSLQSDESFLQAINDILPAEYPLTFGEDAFFRSLRVSSNLSNDTEQDSPLPRLFVSRLTSCYIDKSNQINQMISRL
jgi:hypothetical protein